MVLHLWRPERTAFYAAYLASLSAARCQFVYIRFKLFEPGQPYQQRCAPRTLSHSVSRFLALSVFIDKQPSHAYSA